MKQTATVTKVNGARATVSVRRASACENCASRGSCTDMGAHMHMSTSKNQIIESEAANKIGAVVGDTVTVETNGAQVLIACLLVFIIPLVLAVIGYIVCAALLAITGISDGIVQAISVGVGVLVMLGFFGVCKLVFDKRARRRCIVEITQIISRAGENCTDTNSEEEKIIGQE